eukprot:768104-Hanusia_phi.AAC.13
MCAVELAEIDHPELQPIFIAVYAKASQSKVVMTSAFLLFLSARHAGAVPVELSTGSQWFPRKLSLSKK